MKQWKCTVCGYIHEGEEPPEKCPLCGADKSKFILLAPEETADASVGQQESIVAGKTVEPKPGGKTPAAEINFIYGQMLKHHIHPISVHIPNGVLPLSVVFIFLSALFGFAGLGQAAFYNLLFVAGAMPLVLFSGWVEWKNRYNGASTYIFTAKIICGFVVLATVVVLIIWMMLDPQAADREASGRFGFLIVNLIMLAAAGLAGFLGGKLVFKD